MLCDICHKNIATVHLTEIIEEKVVEMHICQACAKMKAEELKEQLSISDLLGGLVDISDAGEAAKESLRCPVCGLTYTNFKKKGNLGCGSCYKTFKHQLIPLLKKIHGSTRHTGKAPFALDKTVARSLELKELKSRLERAVQLEQYEEAARLRDEIRNLEKQNKI